MNFEVGDTVRLLHSGEEGVITEILGKDLVKVVVEGTDFPIFKDQLEYPYFHRFSAMREEKSRKKKKLSGADIPMEKAEKIKRKETGMFLSLLPVYDEVEEEVVTNMKLYLVNETASSFNYYFKEFLKEHLELELKSHIRPFSRLFLKDFPFENLNDHPRFEFTISPEELMEKMLPSFSYSLKLKPKQIFKKITRLEHQQNATFSYTLFKKYPLKTEKKREDWQNLRLAPSTEPEYVNRYGTSFREKAPYEIDLHIEKLTEDSRSMTPTDMLLLQISTLRTALENAIAHRQYSMVVIHGIGKGVLKKEVHALLKQYPNVKEFKNQHDFRYGFGATEIFFDYST